jgi:hypothetical protein
MAYFGIAGQARNPLSKKYDNNWFGLLIIKKHLPIILIFIIKAVCLICYNRDNYKTPRVSRKYLTLLLQKFFENNFVKSKNKHRFVVAFTTNSKKDYKSGFFRRAKKE